MTLSKAIVFKPVVLESPYAASEESTVEDHMAYLDRCILDCLVRGETPYASHRMLTGALDDTVPEQRELGIKAGISMSATLLSNHARVAIYQDYGISKGMLRAMNIYQSFGIYCDLRTIGRNTEENDT